MGKKPKEICGACGNEDPEKLMECMYCPSTKCEVCDMGNNVECAACTDHEDEELEEDLETDRED